MYMRPKGSAEWLEYRRQWAAALLDEGKGVNEVARLVQASPSSVSRWKAMKAQAGAAGLKAKPHPGTGLSVELPRQGAVEKASAARPASGRL